MKWLLLPAAALIGAVLRRAWLNRIPEPPCTFRLVEAPGDLEDAS